MLLLVFLRGYERKKSDSKLSADCMAWLIAQREFAVDGSIPIYGYKFRKRLQEQPA
jgi:hypothetical protein